MENILPTILAGGNGTRLWPLSRESYPKQFIKFYKHSSLFQTSLARLQGIDASPPLVICNHKHRFLAAEQCHEKKIEVKDIILEPVGRNTAPAIALAAHYALAKQQDPYLLIMPADHHIEDIQLFISKINIAKEYAHKNKLVVFGISPDHPSTAYGYIKSGEIVDIELDDQVYHVENFEEKPNSQRAQALIASDSYYWNSGIFMFKASVYLQELKSHCQDIYNACKKAMQEPDNYQQFIQIDNNAFTACRSESIDYGIMEKTKNAVMVKLAMGWNDLGSWNNVCNMTKKDQDQNHLYGDVIAIQTKDCHVHSETRLIATLGIEKLSIIETGDAVLVTHKDKSQQVKLIVDKIKKQQRKEHENHLKVYRPWGFFEKLDNGERFQVKRITIKPGGNLSLQLHHHRAEHWIVVKGTALVVKGEEEILVSENQSTYIPLGIKHSILNPGQINLELIEVQTGSYLGEDDIIRFKDIYGRC